MNKNGFWHRFSIWSRNRVVCRVGAFILPAILTSELVRSQTFSLKGGLLCALIGWCAEHGWIDKDKIE